jgi:ribosomal peptide maturation radical SAM protein 1
MTGWKHLLRSGDGLIIVPPFAGLDRPSLAAHVLQACAKETGASISVFYANLALAALIGRENYDAICYGSTTALAGERLFARAAYGTPALGHDAADFLKSCAQAGGEAHVVRGEALEAIERQAFEWTQSVALALSSLDYKIAGCTTTFEQTCASVALLGRLKARRPQTVTVLGGANCEGEMAHGIVSTGAAIDFIFSGESEYSFPAFVKAVLSGQPPDSRVITGATNLKLDEIPTPDFREFYEQFAHFFPNSADRVRELWLPYESSRGCWWGQKHHCTFCGINGLGMTFRQKSAERVLQELKELLAKHPSNRVCIVDNIMPFDYFKTLIPRLPAEVPSLHAFYEQKANLKLSQVVALKSAGIAIVQPGIEALSSALLQRMKKGVSARQNIALLRYARAAGLSVSWNLLYGFPGDERRDYEQTLSLLPLMRHLNPPSDLYYLSIDRFSPYFDRPHEYGIRNVRPMDAYFQVFPRSADHAKVAYHFIGDYDSESRASADLMSSIRAEIEAWRGAWSENASALPTLAITRIAPDVFVLLDTRAPAGAEKVQLLNRSEAGLALTARPWSDSPGLEAAVERRWGVKLESWYVPLATAAPDLLAELETNMQEPAAEPKSAPAKQRKSIPLLRY